MTRLHGSCDQSRRERSVTPRAISHAASDLSRPRAISHAAASSSAAAELAEATEAASSSAAEAASGETTLAVTVTAFASGLTRPEAPAIAKPVDFAQGAGGAAPALAPDAREAAASAVTAIASRLIASRLRPEVKAGTSAPSASVKPWKAAQSLLASALAQSVVTSGAVATVKKPLPPRPNPVQASMGEKKGVEPVVKWADPKRRGKPRVGVASIKAPSAHTSSLTVPALSVPTPHVLVPMKGKEVRPVTPPISHADQSRLISHAANPISP